VLIFDEVVTGFRLAWGGAQTLFRITPDMTCLGKIIGGGFPIGAFGGKDSLMRHLSPEGPVYQAGTLSGNPVAVSSGLAALGTLKERNPYLSLEEKTRFFTGELKRLAKQNGHAVTVNAMGSMFTVFFAQGPVIDEETAQRSDVTRYARFFHALLENGVYFPPSQFESCFLSVAHTQEILEKALKKIDVAMRHL